MGIFWVTEQACDKIQTYHNYLVEKYRLTSKDSPCVKGFDGRSVISKAINSLFCFVIVRTDKSLEQHREIEVSIVIAY